MHLWLISKKHCRLKLEKGRREPQDSRQHLHSVEDWNLTLLNVAIDNYDLKRCW
jgi:hypothetical protein